MMRLLRTFVKVVLALVLLVPIAIIVLSTALGVLGALVGLAVLTLRFAVLGLIAWGALRVAVALIGGRKSAEPAPVRELPRPDPYYEAAKRELDQELREVGR
jgi:hypothetical protein